MKRAPKRLTRRRRRAPRKQRGGTATIPKDCIQTSKVPLPEYVTEQLKRHIKEERGWKHTFYDDAAVKKFFTEHSDPDFPDIQRVFDSFTIGPHKADLFRYFYLYKLGGVFIDSDLMLYDDIDTIIGEHTFVSVRALQPVGSIFNGFLAATPKHPIMLDALKHLYATKDAELQASYHMVVSKLGEIVGKHKNGTFFLEEETNNDVFCTIKYPEGHPKAGKVPMIHYQSADIPNIPKC